MLSEEKQNIIERLRSALNELYSHDKDLMLQETHERTICATLACYLKKYFRSYNIDCEYNRNMGDKKACGEYYETYPDILIHKRLSNENNLVFIETKTERNRTLKNEEQDKNKIKCFMKNAPYNYSF